MSADLDMVRTPTRVTTSSLLADLDGTIEQLLRRHLDTTREWFPHEYVPWDRAGDVDFSAEWQPADSAMSEPARVSLYVNLLTEDNLPYYMFELAALGRDGAWGEWTRRWTAEEGRHAIVMRDYLTVTRAIDPVALERGRMQQVST
ncbi:MAG TPA: acyl-ACP desaturase, partial [Acidimicrobiia bacterium]